MAGIGRDLARAQAMLAAKRHDEAASLLALVVAFQPDNSEAWCLLATAHLGAGRHGDAAEAANQAVVAAPSDDRPHRLLSIAQSNLRNAPAAMRAARQACRLAPDQWQAWYCLALASLGSDLTYGVGEQAATKARTLAPEEAHTHYISGRVAIKLSKWKQARTFLEQALALDPAHSDAINELGRISMRRWGQARAADYFIQAAGSAPHKRAYGRNVEVAVWSVIAQVVSLTMIATFALLAAAGTAPSLAWPGLSAIAVLSAVLGAARLLAFPPAARQLLRSRQVMLALSALYGSFIIAIVITAAIPARGQSAPYAVFGVMAIVSACLCYAIWRMKRPWVRPASSR